MKLYIHPGSPNSRRARLAARFCGVSVEEIAVDVPAGENRTRDYLALNPMGKVPTLVTNDGRVLLESYAIAAEFARDHGLMPRDRVSDVLRWMFFDACHFAPPLATLTFQNMFAPVADVDAIDRAIDEWKRFASVVEATLASGEFLLGDGGPTLADLTLLASLTYAEPAKVPLSEYASITRWRTALEGRPEARQTAPPSPPR